MVCSVCGWAEVYAKDRCRSDYMFRRRHKRDRTDEEAARMGQKMLQRQDLRVMLSAYGGVVSP